MLWMVSATDTIPWFVHVKDRRCCMCQQTMHWTLFTDPGWRILSCITPQCRLTGGGSYAVLQGNGCERRLSRHVMPPP